MTGAGTGAGQTTDRSAASPGDRIEEVERPLPGERFVYLDNLKALLIAGIIAAHALIGYADLGSWSYQDIREVTLSPVVETVFEVAFLSLGGLFLIALFFLISGLLTEDSLARHGASRFVHDRLLRLGLPFAVYTLLLWPLFEFALLEPYLHRGSYWDYLGDTDPVLDNGPMWFVGVLLIYSLGYVVWRTRVPRPVFSSGSLGGRHLLILPAVVAASTFLVRLVFPIDSGQPLNLHLWQWPACVVMFGLGVVAARQGWLRPVPEALARRCGIATLIATLVMLIAVLSAGPLGIDEEAFLGGWQVPALITAIVEAVLVVAGPIWVLAVAQRHLNRSGPVRRAMTRSSYAAFMLQGPVLFGLALALRPFDLPGDIKALVVATLGIVGSFALAWSLVTRTPLRRIL
jgi:fucose 4-O-acetylase-like acetyltransferase